MLHLQPIPAAARQHSWRPPGCCSGTPAAAEPLILVPGYLEPGHGQSAGGMPLEACRARPRVTHRWNVESLHVGTIVYAFT